MHLREVFPLTEKVIVPLNCYLEPHCLSTLPSWTSFWWLHHGSPLTQIYEDGSPSSPATLSFFFVKKKDRKLCLWIDYRMFSHFTVKITFPCSYTLTLRGKMFTNWDLCSTYHSIRVCSGMNGKLHSSPLGGILMPYSLMPLCFPSIH